MGIPALLVDVGADGRVWYAVPNRLPALFGTTAEFLASSLLADTEVVRACGSGANADLLLRLYAMKLRQELDSVQVCSPRAAGTRAQRADPARVLVRLFQPLPGGSLGGWHEMVEADYPAYAMARAAPGPERTRFLQCHPAWPAWSFLQPVCPDALADVVAQVVDPRFFVDPFRPDRTSRLEAALGCGSRAGAAPARLLAAAGWPGAAGEAGPAPLSPRAFFFRAATTSGPLRAARLFVRFLAAVWLDALREPAGSGEGLFAPGLFFRDELVAGAFRAHVGRARMR